MLAGRACDSVRVEAGSVCCAGQTGLPQASDVRNEWYAIDRTVPKGHM